MSLYILMREYEERRQALVDQLQKNPKLDPAVQHQIYGAIKEIENFLKSIEFHIANDQEKGIALELSRERPRPLAEKTRKVMKRFKSGTRKVVKEHIPNVTKKMVAVPRKYMERRKQVIRLRKEIEREMMQRMQTPSFDEPLPGVETLEQEKALENMVSEEPQKPVVKKKARKKPVAKKTVKKTAKKKRAKKPKKPAKKKVKKTRKKSRSKR